MFIKKSFAWGWKALTQFLSVKVKKKEREDS